MVGRSLMKSLALSMVAFVAAFAACSASAAPPGPAFKLTTAATTAFPSTASLSSSAAQIISLTTTRAVIISSVTIAATVNSHQEFVLGAQSCAHDGTTSTPSGTACTFSVTFSPFYSGAHIQSLVITDTTGLLYTVGLSGTATGPQALLGPGNTFIQAGSSPGPLFSGDGGVATSGKMGLPANIFVDASNNEYIADYSTGNIRILYNAGAELACLIEIEEPALFGLAAGTTSCAGATSAPVAGDIYTIAGDTSTLSTTTSTHAHGSDDNRIATTVTGTSSTLYQPTGVSVDANGNVVIADYGTYTIRVIYAGGDAMACLIEVEQPTLFGLSSTATSCAGATSAPVPGYIYRIGGTPSSPGITGDGSKATTALMANVIGVTFSPAGDVFLTDDSTQAARTARIRVIYNGGTAAAALIALENPGVTPVLGNIYRICGGVFASTGDGGLANAGGGLLYSRGIAVDAAGDVIFTDYSTVAATTEGKVRVIYNGGTTVAKLITLENPNYTTPVPGYLYTLAGNSGNIGYAGDGGLASAALLKVPYGVALDAAGDIVFADNTGYNIRKINVADGFINAQIGNGTQGTADGNGITTAHVYNPYGVSIGESGTIFFADYGVYRVRDESITPATVAFATAIPVGSTSTPLTVFHANVGNQNLTLASVVLPADFIQIAASTIPTTPITYYPDCAAALVLPPGKSCVVAIEFKPKTGGAVSETLTINDNSLNQTNAPHSVTLTGTSALQTSVALTSSNLNADLGTRVTFTATISLVTGQTVPAGVAALGGTVTFTDGTTVIGTGPYAIDPVSLMANVSTTTLAAGSHTITATFTPATSDYSSSKQSLTEVVVAPAFSVTPTVNGVAVTTGGVVAVPFSILAVGGYTGNITASCTNLPANSACTFAPHSLTFTGDSTQAITLNLSTYGPTASVRNHGSDIAWAMLLGLPGLAMLLRRRRRFSGVLTALLLFLAFTVISGCGTGAIKSSKYAAPGTYGVNVVFTDGATTVTVPVTVSVTGSSWQQ